MWGKWLAITAAAALTAGAAAAQEAGWRTRDPAPDGCHWQAYSRDPAVPHRLYCRRNGELYEAFISPDLNEGTIPAARRGDPAAMRLLAEFYLGEDSNPRQTGLAPDLLTRAAEQGDAEAASDLGWLFITGTLVGRDDTRAISLLTQGAERGSGSALTRLSLLYALGQGVPRNEAEAARLAAAGEARWGDRTTCGLPLMMARGGIDARGGEDRVAAACARAADPAPVALEPLPGVQPDPETGAGGVRIAGPWLAVCSVQGECMLFGFIAPRYPLRPAAYNEGYVAIRITPTGATSLVVSGAPFIDHLSVRGARAWDVRTGSPYICFPDDPVPDEGCGPRARAGPEIAAPLYAALARGSQLDFMANDHQAAVIDLTEAHPLIAWIAERQAAARPAPSPAAAPIASSVADPAWKDVGALTREECPDQHDDPAFSMAVRIAPGRILITHACRGPASAVFLADEATHAVQRLSLPAPPDTPDFTPDLLRSVSFWYGPSALQSDTGGVCGRRVRWRWTGETFQVLSVRLNLGCRGVEVADWPTLYSVE